MLSTMRPCCRNRRLNRSQPDLLTGVVIVVLVGVVVWLIIVSWMGTVSA